MAKRGVIEIVIFVIDCMKDAVVLITGAVKGVVNIHAMPGCHGRINLVGHLYIGELRKILIR